MARQTGIMSFSGPMGGVSFYYHKHYGWLARQSNPVSRERFKTDPAFARTRECNSELGMTATNSALIRNGLTPFLSDVTTDRLDNRLVSFMCKVRESDTVSERGKRRVSVALGINAGLLGGFEFHADHGLFYYTGQEPVVDRVAGTISLREFEADHVPAGATHVGLTGLRGVFDFERNERRIVYSERVMVDVEPFGAGQDVVLHLPEVETSGNSETSGDSGIEVWGMKVVFFQEVNGEMNALRVGAAKILASKGVDDVEDGANEADYANGAEWVDDVNKVNDLWGADDGLSAMLPAAVSGGVMDSC